MPHTLTIAGLDDLEAEHVADILSSYRSEILSNQLDAMARKDVNSVEWYDAHLHWNTEIMKKVSWVKE